MPATPESIIAFDFGLRRIGVAVGQQVTASASPLAVVANNASGPDWRHITSLVEDWRPDRLVVGMPAHVDGSPAELGEVVAGFIGELHRFGLPVDAVDERYTSLEAGKRLASLRAEGLRGKVSKEMVDAGAAVVIAERWLKREHQ